MKAKEYSYYVGYPSVYKGKVPDKYLKGHEKKTPFRPIEELMNEENRVAGTRKLIYQHEHIKIVRVPRDIEHFVVYNMSARLRFTHRNASTWSRMPRLPLREYSLPSGNEVRSRKPHRPKR